MIAADDDAAVEDALDALRAALAPQPLSRDDRISLAARLLAESIALYAPAEVPAAARRVARALIRAADRHAVVLAPAWGRA